MEFKCKDLVFDYKTLRLLVGIIAFAMPIVALFLASEPLSSISASYHYDIARDKFVGMLFIIGALFWAYNGHTSKEAWASKGASIAAILIAIYPTRCAGCKTDTHSIIHYGAAIIMFSILAYFCLVLFREHAKKKGKEGKRRSKIYFYCGSIMIGCMVVIGVTELFNIQIKLRVVFWGEWIALVAFGVAWFVASKCLPSFLVDKNAKDKNGDPDAFQFFRK